MSAPEPGLLLKRLASAKARSSSWIKLLRNAYGLSQPNRNVFQLHQAPGTEKNFYTYDGTLVLATRRFVNQIQSGLVPADQNWMQFALSDRFVREIKNEIQDESQQQAFFDDAKELLQQRTETFFDYMRGSNFSSSINEALYDMAVCTGALLVNEGNEEEPLIFSSVPADKIYFCEGPWGTLDYYFMEFEGLDKDVAMQMWEGIKIPSTITNSQDPQQKLNLVLCSYRSREDKITYTRVIEPGTQTVCWEMQEAEGPFIVFRWSKLPGEEAGRGPVLDAFPSAATVNKAMEDEILAAELMAKPIYMAFSDGLFNPYSFRVDSNTVIPVNPLASGGTFPIQPLPKAGDINFGVIVINDLRMQIDKIMFNTALPPLEETPQTTATEINIRNNERLEDMNASFSRLQREFFFPLIKRVVHILMKKGLMPKFELNGKIIDVKFQTPLSLGRGQIQVSKFMQFYQGLTSIFGPEASATLIHAEKIPRFLAENLDTKLDLVKTQEEIIQTMQQMQEAAQQVSEQQQTAA